MKNIYVGNLSFNTTEEELRAAFEGYGRIERVTVVRDRDTGQPRGFAFVEMSNQVEAEKAISMFNGRSMGQREMKVSLARPREDRGGGGGFGGNRGGGGGRRSDRGGRGY